MEEPAPVESLERPILARRRARRWIAVVAAGPLLVGGGLLGGLLAPRSAHVTHVLVEVPVEPPPPPPLPPPLPPPEPAAVAAPALPARPSCPAPQPAAPRVKVPALPEAVSAIWTSPTNASWVIAYSQEIVYLSVDAGASFQRVLDGPGYVRAVGMDCFGRTFVVRSEATGVRDERGERWRVMPGLELHADQYPADDSAPADFGDLEVLGGGPDLVVIGRSNTGAASARIAISDDLGASWMYRDLESYGLELVSGRQWPDGRIDAVLSLGDCMSESVTWVRISAARKLEHRELAGYRAQIYGDVLVDGTTWRRWSDRPNATPRTLDSDEGDPIPAPFPVIVSGSSAYRVTNGKLRKLPHHIDKEGAHSTRMDLAGRIWSVVCGQPKLAGRSEASETWHLCAN